MDDEAMKRWNDDERCHCEAEFPFGRLARRFSVMLWFSEMYFVSVCGRWPNGMVHLLYVSACSCGLPVFRQSLRWRGTGIVNHHPRGQPMHHSVLPEKGGVVSQEQSSSSRQVVPREGQDAKTESRARQGWF